MRNELDHGANFCKKQLSDRKDIILKMEKIFISNKLKKEKNLYEYLRAIYFTVDVITPKIRRTLIELMKNTIVRLVVNDTSKSRLELIEEESSEDEMSQQEDILDA